MHIKVPALAAASLLLAVGVVAPANAAVSDAEVLAARDSAVTRAEAASLGVKADVSTFTVTDVRTTKGARGDVADIWLCDRPDGSNLSVPGSKVQFSTSHTQEVKNVLRGVEQTTYQYSSAKKASAAYKALVAAAKKCTGNNSDAVDGGASFTTTVSNGTSKVADGDTVVWVLTVGSTGTDGKSFTSHDYGTYHLDGDVIVAIELDLDGPGAQPFTTEQRKKANELVCDSVHRA